MKGQGEVERQELKRLDRIIQTVSAGVKGAWPVLVTWPLARKEDQG